MKNALIKYGFLFLVVPFSWQAVYQAKIFPPYLWPSTSEVVQALAWGFRDRTFLFGMGASIQRIFVGYFISLIFGVLIGFVISRFKWLDLTFGNLIGVLQVLPSICWLPLAILWFGLSEGAIQFVVVMGALLPIAIATEGGIRNIPPLYVQAGRSMGVKGIELYRRVVLPAALPSMMTGMKLGWSFAWRSLMAGELLFVSRGLGQLLQTGRELNDMAHVVAVMILILLIGVVVDNGFFGPLQRRIQKQWGTVI